MLLIQSESELEDFALDTFVKHHESAFVNTPIMFCFDHKKPFEALLAHLNQETQEAKAAAEKEQAEKEQAEQAAKLKQDNSQRGGK